MLSDQDLTKLARLAQLDLPESERQALLPALSAIVDWVGSLQAAPTQGIAPMAHPHDHGLRLREDQVQALPSREALMANAPAQAEGHFLVPRVVE